MFARTEQNDTKQAVIAKLIFFRNLLQRRSPADNANHRFLLDVLKDILDATISTTSLIFPMPECRRAVYEATLYDISSDNPNVKEEKPQPLHVVISLIREIESDIEQERNVNRMAKVMYLNNAFLFTFFVGGAFLLQNTTYVLLLYAVGKAVSSAKIIMLAYASTGILALVLAVYLSLALYCFLNERKLSAQLATLQEQVQQTKVYNFDDAGSMLQYEVDDQGMTLGGRKIERHYYTDEHDPQVGHFKIHYPHVATFFNHLKPTFDTLEPAFHPSLA